jgi:hypothetical protein
MGLFISPDFQTDLLKLKAYWVRLQGIFNATFVDADSSSARVASLSDWSSGSFITRCHASTVSIPITKPNNQLTICLSVMCSSPSAWLQFAPSSLLNPQDHQLLAQILL